MARMLMDVIFRKLASVTVEDLNISTSFETDFQKLRTKLILIHELIQDRSTLRLVSLSYLARDVDNFLDELNFYTFRRHIEKVPFITLLPMKIKLSSWLKNILKKAKIPIEEGLRGELEYLVIRLVGSETASLSVIPIEGEAGTTNTGLAQLAYDDPSVGSHFDLRIWINVGGNLDAGKTMNSILQSLLGESLLGKRFLLVLDNVMSVNQAEWDKLRNQLSRGGRGSTIIVTTPFLWLARSIRSSFASNNHSLDILLENLSPHQRCCLWYSSTFPLNYRINREKLIHQWVALDLIPPISGKLMEETGEEYLSSLLSTFLHFRGVSTDDDGKFLEFVVNESLAKLFEGDNEYAVSRFMRDTLAERALHQFFVPHISSRVLNLSGCGITRLHESIGELICLRYLDLSNTLVEILPKNICYLFNLQTLHLSDCKHLRELPGKISNLINLQHLNIKGCESLARMPPNIGKLQKLQTLSMFIVGNKLEESLVQVKHLNLHGDLEIKQLENVGSLLPDMCLEYKLLQSLVLSWGNDNEAKRDNNSSRHTPKAFDSRHAESILHCLLPNRSLRKLCINEYPGSTFPQWLNRIMLPNLTKLVLFNCRRCETLPQLGPLQSLRVLHLQGMDAVVSIGSEFFGKDHGTKLFPSLCELVLRDFPALKSWESTELMDVFPCLHMLSIINCPMLTSTPCFPSLRHLVIHNCSKLIFGTSEVLDLSSKLASTLQILEISSCPELQDLPDWIERLTSLQSLAILHCQNLKSLSEGLKHLRALQYLSIGDCPHLERRCQKDIGEDWHKILHIPNLNVGSPMPQKGGDGATNSSS